MTLLSQEVNFFLRCKLHFYLEHSNTEDYHIIIFFTWIPFPFVQRVFKRWRKSWQKFANFSRLLCGISYIFYISFAIICGINFMMSLWKHFMWVKRYRTNNVNTSIHSYERKRDLWYHSTPTDLPPHFA